MTKHNKYYYEKDRNGYEYKLTSTTMDDFSDSRVPE